jgi:malonyl-ACP O-methyltransferase BioC
MMAGGRELYLTDKALVAQRFCRSVDTYEDAAVVQRVMSAELVWRLERVVGESWIGRVLELGCGTGLLTRQLVERFRVAELTINDLAAELVEIAAHKVRSCSDVRVQRCVGDMELVSLPGCQDLVVSCAALQWSADPPRMIARMLEALRPGGLLAVATFGPDNVREAGELIGLSLPYLALSSLVGEVGRGAEVLFQHETHTTLCFASALQALQHLKRTGANALEARSWTPRRLREFCERYEARCQVAGEAAGQVALTYHPLTVVARRR